MRDVTDQNDAYLVAALVCEAFYAAKCERLIKVHVLLWSYAHNSFPKLFLNRDGIDALYEKIHQFYKGIWLKIMPLNVFLSAYKSGAYPDKDSRVYYENNSNLARLLVPNSGNCIDIDETDGLRTTFENSDIIRLRASDNMSELYCYS